MIYNGFLTQECFINFKSSKIFSFPGEKLPFFCGILTALSSAEKWEKTEF